MIPVEFQTYALNAAWQNGTQEAAWYGALGNASGYAPDTNTDTAANIASRTGEFSTEISNATRPVWTADDTPATSPSNSNSAARMTFTAASALDVWTFHFTSSSQKQGTGGVLSAAFKLASLRHLEPTDELLVKVTVATSDDTP